jgi:hypothetical protein
MTQAREIYDAIEHLSKLESSPTGLEIAEHTHLSRRKIMYTLNQLEACGSILRTPGKQRSIRCIKPPPDEGELPQDVKFQPLPTILKCLFPGCLHPPHTNAFDYDLTESGEFPKMLVDWAETYVYPKWVDSKLLLKVAKEAVDDAFKDGRIKRPT